MLKVINVVGARPNFMKMAPIIEAMQKYPDRFQPLLVHTGQHYDERMSQSFFVDLGVPKPDLNREVGSGSHAEQTARVMVEFEKVCLGHMPDLVIVVGDVNSTMACTIAAKKLGIRVAHVEAALCDDDSGGVQEAAAVLGVPCITLRNITERPITCEVGTNVVVGNRPDRILHHAMAILKGDAAPGKVPEKWDGKAAERIVQVPACLH
jgi:UDP-N-acetylglucosamine 2-epimerase